MVPLLRLGIPLASVFVFEGVHGRYTPGSIKLDNRTFDKWLDIPGKITFFKIDQMYSYGMKEEEYAKLCELSHGIKNFHTAYIPVGQYGDMDNNDMRVKFGLVKEDFPSFYLVNHGDKKPIRYLGPVDIHHMTTWLRVRGITVRPTGTIKDLDDAVKKFLKRGMLDEDVETIRKMVEGDYDHHPMSFWYLAVTEKVKEKGDEYIAKEVLRLEKVLREKADMHEDKFEDLFNKLQVLTVFHLKEEEVEEEGDGFVEL